MKAKARVGGFFALTASILLLLTVSPVLAQKPGKPAKPDRGGGRLSPASLDLDTCGCPTVFGQPVCEKRTSWTLEKSTVSGPFEDPNNEPFSFTVTVTEGPTTTELRGRGTIVLTNSGDQTTSLSSIVVLLEDKLEGRSQGNAPGPSGKNWNVLATALQNESPVCDANDEAHTCYGMLSRSPGAKLVLTDPDTNDIIALSGQLLIPPTQDNDGDGLRDEDPPLPNDPSLLNRACAKIIDNDGDGLFDEDPIDGVDNDGDGLIDEDDPDDDGDGLVDEDGACEDSVVINFCYSFDITGLGIEGPGDGMIGTADDLRIDLIATFVSGGKRGGTCNIDVDCDGIDEEYVRSIQQRLEFDPPACTPVCDCVTLDDPGAFAVDENCAVVTTNTLNEQISATGVVGTTTTRHISGTVSCVGQNCTTAVTNRATLTCEDPTLIEGSPAIVSFGVTCAGDGNGCCEPGDFCTQTQGGWGVACQGNNPGCLRDTYFAGLFPDGLIVGDPDGPDGDGLYAILLETSADVEDYLPAGGTPTALTNDQTNPETTSSGIFGGQLVAATLNVAFDDAGLGACTLTGTCNFGYPPGTLKTLVYKDCVAAGLLEKSVAQVIAWANCAISGESLASCGVPAGVTISDLSDALATLNQEFVDCATVLGCLGLPN
jgi:hypothetical protein